MRFVVEPGYAWVRVLHDHMEFAQRRSSSLHGVCCRSDRIDMIVAKKRDTNIWAVIDPCQATIPSFAFSFKESLPDQALSCMSD